MSSPLDLKERFPIPRWVPSLIMADTVFGKPIANRKINPVSTDHFNDLISLWDSTNSLEIGAEVVFQASVLGDVNAKVCAIASQIMKNKESSSAKLIETASRILQSQKMNVRPELNSVAKIARRKISISPEDPFANLDLAFCFTANRDIERAMRHVAIAKRYSNGNPYIVRAISRFYLHASDDLELAASFLRDSIRKNPDISLVASEIAASFCADINPRSINLGKKILSSKPEPNWAISELASIFASMEINSGKIKDAKKFANLALLSPNENSLAQILSKFRIITPLSIQNRPSFDYESQAVTAYHKADYNAAIEAGEQWKCFQPFSTKPFIFLSYIYSVIHGDRARALQLSCEGHIVSPDDIIINNNIIFYNLKLGSIRDYSEDILSLLDKSPGGEHTAVLTATQGLQHFRKGEIQEGKRKYDTAIKYFQNLGDKSKELRARCFFLEELACVNDDEYFMELSKIESLMKNNKESDIDILLNRIKDQHAKQIRNELENDHS